MLTCHSAARCEPHLPLRCASIERQPLTQATFVCVKCGYDTACWLALWKGRRSEAALGSSNLPKRLMQPLFELP
jgi:hypothetical protein